MNKYRKLRGSVICKNKKCNSTKTIPKVKNPLSLLRTPINDITVGNKINDHQLVYSEKNEVYDTNMIIDE